MNSKKVVLVTGGSSGIGASICKYLSSKGYVVYGTSRNAKEDQHNGYYLTKLDVENSTSVKECIQRIINIEGKIDVLINNAGVGIMGAVEDSSENEILKAFNINVFGLVRTTQEVLPFMRNQKNGLIINIASIAGHMGLPYRGFYSATKSAVHRITEAMRLEVSSFGIKACIVDPGDFKTNIGDNRVVSDKVKTGKSLYTSETTRIENLINSEINKSLDADIIGPFIYKIITCDNPKTYYRIGKFTQKLSVKLRALIGADLFAPILKSHFKMK